MFNQKGGLKGLMGSAGFGTGLNKYVVFLTTEHPMFQIVYFPNGHMLMSRGFAWGNPSFVSSAIHLWTPAFETIWKLNEPHELC